METSRPEDQDAFVSSSQEWLALWTGVRHAWMLLTPSLRLQWVSMLPISLLTALLEASGAVVVYALITVLTQPEDIQTLPLLSRLYDLIPWRDPHVILISFMSLVALYYVFKNSLLISTGYLGSYISSQTTSVLSQRLQQRYLAAPYIFHLQRNSSELIRNVTWTVDTLCRLVIGSTVNLFTESCVVVALVIMLMATSPLVTSLMLLGLSGFLMLSLKLTKARMAKWGTYQQHLQRASLKTLQQSLGGIKEIKVMGREAMFARAFSHWQHEIARAGRRVGLLLAAPRVIIETFVVLAMLSVSLLVILSGRASTHLVPLLGLYAYAGFRLIPCGNRLVMHLNLMHQGLSAVDHVYTDMTQLEALSWSCETPEPIAPEAPRFSDRLVLNQVSYTYPKASAPAINNLSFSLRRGETIGIVGPTGAGKSTLASLLLGLLAPDQGQILLDGKDIAENLPAWRRQIGYVPQELYLLDDTLRRNIAFGLPDDQIQDAQVWAALRIAQLDDVVTTLPLGLETLLGERGMRLSGGQRQRVAIARAVYHQPRVLIFDEATSALDSQTERAVAHSLQTLRREKTLIIIAHRLSTVSACDRLLFLDHGHLQAYNTFDYLVEHNARFRQMAVGTMT